MITLIELANFFENGINNNIEYPNVFVRIWANAGKKIPPLRQGNTVSYFFSGSLRIAGSNDASMSIQAGVNNLTLDIELPQEPPKTTADQMGAELYPVMDDQYWFPNEIIAACDKFFDSVKTINLVDADGKSFSLGIRAGLGLSGEVGLRSPSSAYVNVLYNIELTYVQGGINSRASTLAIDTEDNFIAYMEKAIPRAASEQPDVYLGFTAKKSVDNATAFGIQLSAPATIDLSAFDSYFYDGALNVAHFVIETDNEVPHYYWMKVNNLRRNASNIQNVGLTINLVEASNDMEIVDVPPSYQVARFEFSSSQDYTLTFTPSAGGLLAWTKGVVPITAGKSVSLALTGECFAYDDENDVYYVYVITNTAMSVTGAQMEIVKEAS